MIINEFGSILNHLDDRSVRVPSPFNLDIQGLCSICKHLDARSSTFSFYPCLRALLDTKILGSNDEYIDQGGRTTEYAHHQGIGLTR